MSEEEKNITVKHGNPFMSSFKGTLGKGLGCFTIVVIVIVVIAALSSGGNKSQKVGENDQTQTASETKSQPSPQQDYKVGDKVQMGKVILTVNKVEKSQGAQYTKPSEGNEWLNLNVTLENTGSTQEFVTTLGQMFIVDDKGNQFQVAVTDKRLDNAGTLGLDGAIVASAKKTDWVGFEVPKSATGLKFQYNASFFSSKKIVVALGE